MLVCVLLFKMTFMTQCIHYEPYNMQSHADNMYSNFEKLIA
uniref:Uncharacterized protein n=1 Tax=Arundo donax TaxID=35708 RepID=A0A0A8YEJ6_ARUDO